MKTIKSILIAIVLCSPSHLHAQVLGGYTLFDCLESAVDSNNCNEDFVTGFPDDSVWVNFDNYNSMTGNFAKRSVDGAGDDLLLETGFNTSNYEVSLLLSSGLYSAIHTVNVSDWTLLPNFIPWKYLYVDCTGDSQTSSQYIVPLDFAADFGLTSSDTVTGIKIIFLPTFSAADFAGAYIISPNQVGIESAEKEMPGIYPNPFSEYLIISGIQGEGEIDLFDVHSRKVLHQKVLDNVPIFTTDLPKGIYIYEIKRNNALVRKGTVMKN